MEAQADAPNRIRTWDGTRYRQSCSTRAPAERQVPEHRRWSISLKPTFGLLQLRSLDPFSYDCTLLRGPAPGLCTPDVHRHRRVVTSWAVDWLGKTVTQHEAAILHGDCPYNRTIPLSVTSTLLHSGVGPVPTVASRSNGRFQLARVTPPLSHALLLRSYTTFFRRICAMKAESCQRSLVLIVPCSSGEDDSRLLCARIGSLPSFQQHPPLQAYNGGQLIRGACTPPAKSAICRHDTAVVTVHNQESIVPNLEDQCSQT